MSPRDLDWDSTVLTALRTALSASRRRTYIGTGARDLAAALLRDPRCVRRTCSRPDIGPIGTSIGAPADARSGRRPRRDPVGARAIASVTPSSARSAGSGTRNRSPRSCGGVIGHPDRLAGRAARCRGGGRPARRPGEASSRRADPPDRRGAQRAGPDPRYRRRTARQPEPARRCGPADARRPAPWSGTGVAGRGSRDDRCCRVRVAPKISRGRVRRRPRTGRGHRTRGRRSAEPTRAARLLRPAGFDDVLAAVVALDDPAVPRLLSRCGIESGQLLIMTS